MLAPSTISTSVMPVSLAAIPPSKERFPANGQVGRRIGLDGDRKQLATPWGYTQPPSTAASPGRSTAVTRGRYPGARSVTIT